MKRAFFLFALILAQAPAAAQDSKAPSFESHIRPLLKAYCFECHGDGVKLKGGLDVRLKRLLLEGGNTAPAIQPGKPGDSLIIKRVTKGEMPPGKRKLTKEEIGLLERWIAAGAPTAAPEPKELPKGFFISAEDRAFWVFQPIQRREPPKVKNAGLVRNPIDAFLLARLEKSDLSFSAETDRRTLI